jgi:hypothetical protein
VTEDQVFEGVRRLVLAGEYRDWRCQQLGPAVEPLRRLPDGQVDLADLPRWRRERPRYRRFDRGTREYVSTRDAGLLKPLPPLTPASREAVAEAEEVFGFPLPRLLRRLYLEVGNGGFGPRRGILGVRGGVPDGDWDDILQSSRPRDPEGPVPASFIWVFDWGCAIWSLIDSSDPAGQMWAWDSNQLPGRNLISQDQTLAEWLGLWLDGQLSMPKGTQPDGLARPGRASQR